MKVFGQYTRCNGAGNIMRVFLSWSGEQSRLLAEALSAWLPNVHQQIEIFFSPNDIEKGAKWANEIEAQLRDTQYCLVCLTAEALQSSWINFEAGAISKGIGQNRITPILFEIPKSEVSGPLSLFQLADFAKDEMRQVLKSINATAEDAKLKDDILSGAFERWWPDLENSVSTILKQTPSKKAPQKTQRELTDEILLNTREIMKEVARTSSRGPRNAVAMLAGINITITKIQQIAVAEEYSDILPFVRRLGSRVSTLNGTLGKTGGSSLIELRKWLLETTKPEKENDPVGSDQADNIPSTAGDGGDAA